MNTFQSIDRLSTRLVDDLRESDDVLLFAYNGVGKTRLSMAFKDRLKQQRNNVGPKVLYFNAFTEDLFTWDNDLNEDQQRFLKINENSNFIRGLQGLSIEDKIRDIVRNYAQFDFRIDYDHWNISFSRIVKNPRFHPENPHNTEPETITQDLIKISRGEEMIFIFAVFMAICQLAVDGHVGYSWVKYIYVDDPISSLDENNAIAIASDLARLIKRDSEVNGINKKKYVISSHHSLFFNVIYNELKDFKHKSYFLYRTKDDVYKLNSTKDHPFFHHISDLCELQQCVSNFENLEKTNTKLTESKFLKTYHFNMMRAILEKTAVFFGLDRFSDCLNGVENSDLYARLLNIMSHGSYSIYEPKAMVRDNAELFVQLFRAFQTKYQFVLPNDLASAF